MKKLILAAAMAAFCGAAGAGDIYKCTANGKVTYSEKPCETGVEAKLATPAQPARDVAFEQRLERQRSLIEKLDREKQEAERAAERAAQARAYQAQRNAASKHRCDVLRAQHQERADAVSRQGTRASGAARVNIQRSADSLAQQCPG
jgi:hypothetical protein